MTRLDPYRFAGGTAVVTGAASGMGEQLAHGLARRGSHLVLLDRDAARLAGVVEAVRRESPHVEITSIVADLAERAQTEAAAAQILREHPRVTLLVNNAGVALGGRFDQVSLEDFEWVLEINLHAPVVLTHRLLPRLTASPGSHVVNVSSLYGLVAPPGQAAYSTSKFGLRGFSEVLRGELAPRGVGVTTVHPGGIKTRVAESARIPAGATDEEVAAQRARFAGLLTYPADRAAEDILGAVEKRRGRLLIAWSARIPDVLARLLPSSNMVVLGKLTELATRRR